MRVRHIVQIRHGRIWVAIVIVAIFGFCIAAIIFLSAKAKEPFTIDGFYGFLH